MQGRPPGLRERKKRAAREAIALAARRLFAQHGFDAVTVAQVAAAADVSEKTVFNHFATKEDLVFSRRREGYERLLAAIESRPPGTPVVDVFRAATAGVIDELLGGDNDELREMPRIIAGSAALQARVGVGWQEDAAALAAVIGGPDADALEAAVVARTLFGAMATVFRAGLEGLAANEDPETLGARLRASADATYDRLAGGLADYGATP